MNTANPTAPSEAAMQGITPRHIREAGNLPAPPRMDDALTERLKDAHRFGLLAGALMGLKWQVDEATRHKIDAILKDAGVSI